MTDRRPTQTHSSNERKRVRKACDRCCLKKSKCDGHSPCSRCRLDNSICVFGERKQTRDKKYPKGYVELLEKQQKCLVQGLQEMYSHIVRGQGFLDESIKPGPNGFPLVHELLDSLGALKQMNGGIFEEFLPAARQRLLLKDLNRQDSFESSSETYPRNPCSTFTGSFPAQSILSPSRSINSCFATIHSESLLFSQTGALEDVFSEQDPILIHDSLYETPFDWPDPGTNQDNSTMDEAGDLFIGGDYITPKLQGVETSSTVYKTLHHRLFNDDAVSSRSSDQLSDFLSY